MQKIASQKISFMVKLDFVRGGISLCDVLQEENAISDK